MVLWVSSWACGPPVNLEVSVQSFAHFRRGLSFGVEFWDFEHDLPIEPLKG